MRGLDLIKHKQKVSVSMCYLLRHGAIKENVNIDAKGFVYISDVLHWLNTHSENLNCDLNMLDEIVVEDEKRRYEIVEDKIRCVQGHSILIEEAPLSQYKGDIYHGTSKRFLKAILKSGLNGQLRNHVHMSKDIETATAVGNRHGESVVLKISHEAFSDDNPLLESSNGVLLAKHIDPKYIEVL